MVRTIVTVCLLSLSCVGCSDKRQVADSTTMQAEKESVPSSGMVGNLEPTGPGSALADENSTLINKEVEVKNVTEVSFEDVLFSPLMVGEVLGYERITSKNWGIRFFVRSVDGERQQQFIGEWANCLSSPQIVRNSRGCFFTVTNPKSRLDWLFFVDGDNGIVKYIMEVPSIYRASIDGRYLLYSDPAVSHESEVYYFIQYDFLAGKVVQRYQWKPKSLEQYDSFIFLIQRRGRDEIHFFAGADTMFFAELSVDPGKQTFEILWDATDQPTTDFKLETKTDADLMSP